MNVGYTILIYPLYTLIECIYVLFDKLTSGNLGFSIIGVSIGITLLCLPLYAVAEHWQEVERAKQKLMQPGIDRIKKAFKGDERYMMTTTFYREHHYSPIMALRSSFGLLIQIPFFMAAYAFLSHLPALQGRAFLFIKDLGSPDALFHVGNFPINVLPITMTIINMIAGTIYTKGLPVKEKIQIYGMALVFLAILYNSPSGLVVYWTMNNVFSLIKNIFYKLKNPLKVFYITVCVILTIVLLYVLFLFYTKPVNKVISFLCVAIVYSLPLMKKGIELLLKTVLQPLVLDAKTRHTIFFLSLIVGALLFSLNIPTALISSSPVEFAGIGSHPNPLFYIANTAIQVVGIFMVWFTCIYFLFNAQVQTVFTMVLCMCTCCGLLNSYIFMLSYGDISASLSFLNSVTFKSLSLIAVINVLCLIGLAGLILFLLYWKKGIVLMYASIISIFALTATSLINIYTISKQYDEYQKNTDTNALTSITPIFHLSKNHNNVVLIMLDRAQNQFVQPLMQEAPDVQDAFTGFVSYENVLSYNGHTLMGAPGLFGGYEYTPDEMNKRSDTPLATKNNESQLLLPRLFTETKGYSATVTDPTWPNFNSYCDLSIFDPYPLINGYQTMGKYTQLWYKTQGKNTDFDTTEDSIKRNLLFFSFFRASPIFLRELIYKQGTYWSTNKNITNVKRVLDNYAALYFLKELTTVSDTENGTYTSILNELTHENIYFQAPDYVPVSHVTNRGTSPFKDRLSYHTQMASFKMVASWLNYLKENGVYDNTRIIIVSDHGESATEPYFENNPELDKQVASTAFWGRGHYHPILLFKDFNAKGNITYDTTTFMTNADCPALLLKGLIDKPINPFTKKEIPLDTTPLKQKGVIITTSDKHQPVYHGKYIFDITDNEWWQVTDPISNSSSWTKK